MVEHPILFQGWKVRTILDWDFDVQGDMQTRRVIKPQPSGEGFTLLTCMSTAGDKRHEGRHHWGKLGGTDGLEILLDDGVYFSCPYGKPGDRLWVRETFYQHGKWVKNGLTKTGKQAWRFKPTKHADGEDVRLIDNPPKIVRPNKYRKPGWYKRPSIFMPRWASRVLLEVTNVRVERVADITAQDAVDEGLYVWTESATRSRYGIERADVWERDPRKTFKRLWNKINMKRGYGWGKNPWVWVVSFKRIKP